ncbi:MAG: hypothetical protein QGH94_11245 [Phycisphaerae bacterium]|jgi:hypothetical protein|nr:hypothetical protein [Phycisphaerae bacterium]MDP7288557.1 hypothetical protein [Phycisphaerae bacterium]
MQHEEPKAPPRAFDWDRYTNLWSVQLKIAALVVPVVLVGATIWFICSPDKYSGPPFFIGWLVVPIYIRMAMSRYTMYRDAPAYPCTITKIMRQDDLAFATSRYIVYEYEIDGEVYTGAHLTEQHKLWRVGDTAYVLVHFKRPGKSYLWQGATVRKNKRGRFPGESPPDR